MSEQMPKSDTILLRNKFVSDACELFFRQDPIKIVRGEGQYMYDEQGRQYLDCINNVAHVGHCNGTVVKALTDQLGLLNTNNRFLHDTLVLCASKLLSIFPEELQVCFFVNSGSEANDLALRLARAYSDHKDIICLESAYHGHLTSLIEISPYKFPRGKFPKEEWVHVAPIPDSFRGIHRGERTEELGLRYAEEVKKIIDQQIHDKGRGLAAFIAESIPSCAGQILFPPNYLRHVYKYVRNAGGLCIADEVQTGFGRVGKHWWSFQLQGDDVVPDIVTVGKSMGNGFPVAAVICRAEIAQKFKSSGMGYFNTYGGNAAACASALAVIEVVEKSHLKENATIVGQHLLRSLDELYQKYEEVGEVRGIGLFVGIEVVDNKMNRNPNTDLAKRVVKGMKERFILLSTDGPDDNVIKFKPPMVFSCSNVDYLVDNLKTVFAQEIAQGRK